MSSEQQPTSSTSIREYLAQNPIVALLGLVAILALIAAVFLGILLVRSGDDGVAIGGDGTPTPFAVGPGGGPAEEPLVFGVSESTTISVTLDVPVTLQLAGQNFAVSPQQIPADGVWSPEVNAGTAVWVYGSIINYVIGLPDTNNARNLLEQLAPGSEIVMQTRGGNAYTFTFDRRDVVANTNRDIFAQNMPGITLVIVGGGGQERLVVHGRYVVPEAADTNIDVIELGEAAQLDNIQLVVNSVSYLPNRPEAPPGFAFFLVDYEAQNLGLTALDTANLQFQLQDAVGNTYAISAVASQLGNFPVLTGFLNANQQAAATAGFQVPAGLNSENVTMILTRRDTSGQLLVELPFSGSGAAAAQGSSISLNRAEVSPDFTSLILAGQVTNLGERPLVVVEQDVALRTEDGASYLLLSTNPPFPWTVPPGQTLQYTFAFQRPAGTTAVFNLLNQPFQLNNLR